MATVKNQEAKEESFGGSELGTHTATNAQPAVYHKGGDEALKVLGDSTISHAPITDDEVRRLRRKIDLRVIPGLWLVLGLQYADKTALGTGALFGILEDLDLKVVVSEVPHVTNTKRYSDATMIVNVGIICGAFGLAWVGQRFPTGKVLASYVLAWGFIAAMTPLCKSYEGIVVQRFFLGLMEGAANPAWLHIIGMWYLKKEQALMALVVNSGPAFFGLIYGSLMYGVTQIGEEDHAWKVVFYFVGPMTILGALFLLYWIPDSPASSKWLSPRERYVAVERLRENQAGVITKQFKLKQALSAFKDPKCIILFMLAFCTTTPAAAVGAFGGLVIKQLYGASARRSLLLQLPASVIAGIVTIGSGYFAMRFRNLRIICMISVSLICMVGCLLQWQIPLDKKGGLLAGVYLAATYSGAYGQVLGLAVSNTAGSSKRSFVISGAYSSAAIASICGPYYFAGNQAPRYMKGFKITTIIMCIGLGLSVLYAVICFSENKRRQKMEQSEEDHAFEDLTDVQNKAFKYSY